MDEKNQRRQHTEYGGGVGDDRTRYDGTPPPTTGQRAVDARRAGLRDQPLPKGTAPGRRVS